MDSTGIWLDDPQGQTAVVVTAQGPKLISKMDENTPRLGKDGKPIAGDEGTRLSSDDAAPGAGIDSIDEIPEPDEDGVDDPPVAQDDTASAREGIEVAVIATANDYDPDGDPNTIVDVTSGRSGEVSILDSTTLVYSPDAGSIGTDTFTYTISDPAGQEATAEVSVEMIAADEVQPTPDRESRQGGDGGEPGRRHRRAPQRLRSGTYAIVGGRHHAAGNRPRAASSERFSLMAARR